MTKVTTTNKHPESCPKCGSYNIKEFMTGIIAYYHNPQRQFGCYCLDCEHGWSVIERADKFTIEED